LLEKCVQHGVKRVVFLSSAAVYGATDVHPTPETVFPNPMSSYGATKLAIEHYLSVFQTLHGLEYCTLRIANPYGPRQDPRSKQGVIAIFAAQAVSGDPISINGDGSAERDYIHAKDCADAVLTAARTDAKNYVANVGSGTCVSLNKIITELENEIGTTANVTRSAVRSGDVSRSVLDISKFTDLTGWTPKIPLNDGIADVMAWMHQTKF
jgi:UDP-glucose 4-epimerase